MAVTFEISDGSSGSALIATYQEILRQKTGVAIAVAFAKPGALAELTGIETRQKPQRLIDERF